MHVAVVYESLYGNTHEVAGAIARGIADARPDATVDVVRVGEADLQRLSGTDLLIVGGPTHIRGMTTGLSRHMGVVGEAKKEPAQAHELEPGAAGPGVRDWLHDLPKAVTGRMAAAFDTRIDARLAGGASNGIAQRLRRHGYDVVAEPEGFHVQDDGEGPLKDGELDRARAWAAEIVRRVAPVASA
jgi:hypothetical protein